MRGFGSIPLVVSGLFLALATAVLGAATLNAIRVGEGETVLQGPGDRSPEAGKVDALVVGDPPEGSLASTGHAGESLLGTGTRYPGVSEDELLVAVNHDVFQPDRLPPSDRYELPGQRVDPLEEPDEDRRRQRGPELRVVGSAMAGDVGLALIQVDDSVPFAVLLGEEVEGYTLVAVEGESATLMGPSETLTLPVVAPLATNDPRSGRSSQVQMDPQSFEAVQRQLQEVLRARMMNARRQIDTRGGRGGGGSP